MQVALNIAHRHAQCIHRQDLGVESFEPRLVLLDQLRLERAVAIARHLDRHLPGFAFQRLLALAVARVAASIAGHLVLLIAQVMVHLTGQHPLHQRLGQLLHQPVRADQAPPLVAINSSISSFLIAIRFSYLLSSQRTAFTQSFLHPPPDQCDCLNSSLGEQGHRWATSVIPAFTGIYLLTGPK